MSSCALTARIMAHVNNVVNFLLCAREVATYGRFAEQFFQSGSD